MSAHDRRVANIMRMIPGIGQETATKVATSVANPILALLRDEERSRTRLVKLIKAQERLLDAYRKNQHPFVDDRQRAVDQAAAVVERYGDKLTHDLADDA